MSELKRIAIFFSGRGGSAENLIKSSKYQKIYTVDLLICSDANAPGIERLSDHGIPISVVPWDRSKTSHELSSECFRLCDEALIDVVCLAGWLKQLVLPPNWGSKVLNIHPSLLPDYGGKGMYGIKVHQSVIECGEKISGCTVHLIDNELDRGTILGQSKIEVANNDTPTTLQEKIYKLELDLYPQVLLNFLSN